MESPLPPPNSVLPFRRDTIQTRLMTLYDYIDASLPYIFAGSLLLIVAAPIAGFVMLFRKTRI